jgi:hypothetical protein
MSAEQDLVKGKDTMMPLVDFQEKKRTGWRQLKIPSSGVVRCLSNICYTVERFNNLMRRCYPSFDISFSCRSLLMVLMPYIQH